MMESLHPSPAEKALDRQISDPTLQPMATVNILSSTISHNKITSPPPVSIALRTWQMLGLAMPVDPDSAFRSLSIKRTRGCRPSNRPRVAYFHPLVASPHETPRVSHLSGAGMSPGPRAPSHPAASAKRRPGHRVDVRIARQLDVLCQHARLGREHPRCSARLVRYQSVFPDSRLGVIGRRAPPD